MIEFSTKLDDTRAVVRRDLIAGASIRAAKNGRADERRIRVHLAGGCVVDGKTTLLDEDVSLEQAEGVYAAVLREIEIFERTAEGAGA